MSAAERSAGPLLALIAFTARCNASRSPVTEATIRAVGPTAMIVIRSDGPSWSMTALTCRLASPRRDGERSVACIDADASTITRLCRARAAPAGRAGCSAAATRTAAARSCRNSSQLGRSRCQGTLAWRSRIWLGQRCKAGTIRVGRRIFRKYSATIAGIVSARTAAAGARKLIRAARCGAASAAPCHRLRGPWITGRSAGRAGARPARARSCGWRGRSRRRPASAGWP